MRVNPVSLPLSSDFLFITAVGESRVDLQISPKNPLTKQGGMRSSSSFPSVIKDNTGRSAGRSCSCNLQCQTPEKKYSLQQSNEAKSLGLVGSCRISNMKSMKFSKVVSQFTSHFPQPCTSFHDDAKCF